MPGEDDGANRQYHPFSSNDTERWERKKYPQRGDEENTDEECSKCWTCSGGCSRALRREEVSKAKEGIEKDVAARCKDFQGFNNLVKRLLMSDVRIFGSIPFMLLLRRLLLACRAGRGKRRVAARVHA